MTNNNDDVIPKLKFISKLNKGDKINVKNLYIQQNNFMDKINRTFFNIDDRTNTLIFVSNTLKKGFGLYLEHVDKPSPFDSILCQNIVSDLKNSKNGMLNLKETYSDDIMFVCKIDALIEETDAKLAEIQNKYKDEKKEEKKEEKKK